jgi:hypothetical protein
MLRYSVRRIFLVCLFTLLVVIPCRSTSAQGVLPASFGSWTASPATNSQPITLQQAAGADAPIVDEYGFESLEHQDYSSGKKTFSVTLYRMVDPTAAYGAFTFLRPPTMEDSKLEQFAATSQSRALIVVGNFLLDIKGERIPASSDDLATLVAAIKPKADHRPFPSIADHFPSEGLIPSSERYILGPLALQKLLPVAQGDWLGFAQGTEAMLARYRKGPQEVTLLVAEYPTQQLAADRFNKMSPILAGLSTGTPSPAHPKVFSRREAGLIVLAFDSRPGGYGDALLSQVAFGHNVIWNEPKFTATEPSMNVYIVGAFVGTGAICLIAIVSGLGFALLRLVVKFFFPGKVFDRPRSIEVIQLDINGRSVNTKDFY